MLGTVLKGWRDSFKIKRGWTMSASELSEGDPEWGEDEEEDPESEFDGGEGPEEEED